MLPLKIMLLLLTWAIGYLVGKVAGSILLPVTVVGSLVLLERRATSAIRVRMSPGGVELLGRKKRIDRMCWPDIQRISFVGPNPRVIVVPGGAMQGIGEGAIRDSLDAKSGPGLAGMAVRLSRAEARQQRAQGPWPWIPAEGEPRPCGLGLSQVDRYWQQGQMGAWVRRYRPDLFTAPNGSGQ